MKRILIVGAGGHAQVIADILWRAHEAGAPLAPIGYLDDNPHLHGEQRLGLPILSAIRNIGSVPHDGVVLGIGDNHVRREIFEYLWQCGEQFVVACHPSAIIAPDVPLGLGTVIAARVVVNPGSWIGSNVILNTGCSVDHHNQIGDHCHIAPGVTLGGDVTIGVGSLIGIGSTVMPQRSIGAESIVGAGALVHASLPARVVATGVPARIIREAGLRRQI